MKKKFETFRIIFSNSEKFAEFEWYTAPERRGAT